MEYISLCRSLFKKGVSPLSANRFETKEYEALVKIVKSSAIKGNINHIAGFFQEGTFFIQLWTAHLILEYGDPSESLREDCIEEIKKYASNSLSPEVAFEEKMWLKENT